ncbi:Na+/H+ antiporter [Brevibacillus sp. TJ4]|uniref:Na+/H+ antiporter n=1 Tax=Brevibacillus sp. TJ4 TaxID=3234853 RepID=UPI0037D0EF42
MEVLTTVIILLICLLVSNIISHYIPFIPTALTQIAFGIILALLFGELSLPIETHLFLLLFVAPLLYNDGRHFPREELWRMRASILGNAVLLVLVTTLVGGYFIHWMIPTIPLAAAFALAAILSPTDPVAVNGIAKRIHIPEKVLHLVRGESLINDASGLVAFNYAIAAVVTGYFSVWEATTDFFYMFVAGAVLGLVLGVLITWVRFTLRKQGINDVTFHSLLQLITPFVIFIITEEWFHASGVIAVVVGGIVHTLVREQTETMVAEEQVLTENLWTIVLYVLNGVVFLLLGLNIPSSMVETLESPNMENWLIIGFVIAIGIVILGIRFVWSYLFSPSDEKPTFANSLVVSLTGVRGAVTMAGVLSIPLVVASGEAFPERSLILFLAAGVILFTLIIATVCLPLVSKGEAATEGEPRQTDVQAAKQRLLQVAIQKLSKETGEYSEAVVYDLIRTYKRMSRRMQPEPESPEQQQKVREIRLLALKAERKYIHELLAQQKIDEELFVLFENALDYREEALSTDAQTGAIHLIGKMARGWMRLMGKFRKEKTGRDVNISAGKDIQLQALQAALHRLEEYGRAHDQKRIVDAVILEYRRMIAHLEHPTAGYHAEQEEQKEELRLKVMDFQRSEIRKMFESGEITREQAKELRRFVNSIESVALFEHAE